MERMGVGVLMTAHLSQEVRRGVLKIVNAGRALPSPVLRNFTAQLLYGRAKVVHYISLYACARRYSMRERRGAFSLT